MPGTLPRCVELEGWKELEHFGYTIPVKEGTMITGGNIYGANIMYQGGKPRGRIFKYLESYTFAENLLDVIKESPLMADPKENRRAFQVYYGYAIPREWFFLKSGNWIRKRYDLTNLAKTVEDQLFEIFGKGSDDSMSVMNIHEKYPVDEEQATILLQITTYGIPE